MIDHLNNEIAAIGVRLLDEAYLAWFAAESDSQLALRNWLESPVATRECAYGAYLAALDREEAAALDLERLWAVSEPCRNALAAG